jgi:hypothetical protein
MQYLTCDVVLNRPLARHQTTEEGYSTHISQ